METAAAAAAAPVERRPLLRGVFDVVATVVAFPAIVWLVYNAYGVTGKLGAAAFGVGEKTDDPLAMYLCDILTVAANLAGIPAVSIPCGQTEEGLPLGLQLWGPPGSEGRLLDVAGRIAETTGHGYTAPVLKGAE